MATPTDPKTETKKTLQLGLFIAAASVGILVLIAVFRPAEPTADAVRNHPQGGPQTQESQVPVPYTPTVPPPQEMSPELREKYWSEMKAKALARAKEPARTAPGGPTNRYLTKLTPEEREKQRAIVLDAGRRGADRAMSWRVLQMAGEHGPDVNQAVTQLLRSSSDPQLRATICEYLSADPDEQLKAELIERLRFDSEVRVREHAARALAANGQDPVARVALEYAMNTDPEEAVKAIARAVIFR
jgi:hypothetical protein